MLDLFSIWLSHDPRLVVLAALVCIVSATMAQPVLDRTSSALTSVSWFWIAVSGVVIGSSVWSVHFIAVLALEFGSNQRQDLFWALASLGMSIAGFTVFGATMRLPQGRRFSILKAVVLTGAIATMHYAGMMGVHGTHVMTHVPTIVVISLILSLFPALFFLRLATGLQTSLVKLGRTAAFTLTVLNVHFGGMVAMVHIGMAEPSDAVLIDPHLFSTTVAMVTSLVLIFAAALVYLEKRNVELFEQRSREGQFISYISGTSNRAGIIRDLKVLMAKEHPTNLIGLKLIGLREARDLVGRPYLSKYIANLARRLASAAGPHSHIGYAGEGMFYILLPAQETEPDCAVAEDLRTALGPFDLLCDGQRIVFDMAFGLAHYPADAYNAEDLIDYCEFAVECAKDAGTNTIARFEKDRLEERTKRHRLALDIREALRTGALELHYQPQAALDPSRDSPTVCGFEALARWSHPKYGRIPPDVFVPLCETGGLNRELAHWVLMTACAEFASWPTDHSVAVNIPPDLLNGPELIDMVRAALDQSGLSPQRLEIEVTERGIIDDVDAARTCIAALQALGVSVALDDFGAGDASMQTLFQIPLNKIKLDRMFLPSNDMDQRSTAILEATAFIANRLGAQVLAEGVETEAQLTLLRNIGYGALQGYLIAPALPAAEARRRYLPEQRMRRAGD